MYCNSTFGGKNYLGIQWLPFAFMRTFVSTMLDSFKIRESQVYPNYKSIYRYTTKTNTKLT